MSEPSASSNVSLSRTALAWTAVGVVAAVILAAVLGGWIGGSLSSRDGAEPAPSASATEEVVPEPEETEDAGEEAAIDEELEEIIDQILPAGADVRAGTGAPASDHGDVGDVYINLTNSDVYVRRASGWERVGNLRVDTAENLRGPQGVPGSPGDRGPTGEAGRDGTQVVLGADAPDPDDVCSPDSIYIDTSTSTYFECVDGVWQLFGGSATDGAGTDG